ncbi:MAG: RHS repeat protein [Candidatus Eremiobacteraeota bacterium]|nr:RHS repeat protein [Candidatus Eremiobacteraeota bacterium]
MEVANRLHAFCLPVSLLVLCACGGQAALLPAAFAPTGASVSTGEQTLDFPDRATTNQLLGINDYGEIAGLAHRASQAYAYIVGKPYGQHDVAMKTFPAARTTTITALNGSGTIVGFYAEPTGAIAAFEERDGRWSRYSHAGSNQTEYLGVNDDGSTVGFYADARGIRHAFEYDGLTKQLRLIRPPGGLSVTATAINNRGDIVGYMTTERGRVTGFLAQRERMTEFSYPGAVETKALGISADAFIVGSYVDAGGVTHGFALRGPRNHAQWQSIDASNAHGLTVVTGINVGRELVGYYRDGASRMRAFLRPMTMKPPQGVPLVIPVWGFGGDSFNTDPGATPDQNLFAAIEDTGYYTSRSLASNCPGVSSSSTCQPFKYVDFFYDFCNTQLTREAYQWADAHDESAFTHVYPGAVAKSNRIVYDATPNPSGPNCHPDNPNAVMRMNPGDSAFNAFLYKTAWSGSNYINDFPAPYGAMEDNASSFGSVYVGSYGGKVTTEYGSGSSPSGFANVIGNSPFHAATDWETAMGIFVNAACAAKCVGMALNGVATGAGYVGSCKDVANGHCHGRYASGNIDNQAAIDNLCNTVTGGNLKYLMAERPIFGGRLGFEFMDSQTMTVEINTAANLYSHTSDGCATTKIVDHEVSYGEGGRGDITGGYQVRLAALAFRWLVPDPATGIPDRVISLQETEGGTLHEAPYFFEDTLVPAGAETPVSRYVWNGAVRTNGGGCPSASGDGGGAISLLAQCVGSAGIYCQQYQHLYIDGTDFGKAAACLNTSNTTEKIVGSWFKNDPISSYQYRLSLQGGELASVAYSGVSGGSIAMTTCTSKQYCTGNQWLSNQVATFEGDGTDTLCGPCGVILLADE